MQRRGGRAQDAAHRAVTEEVFDVHTLSDETEADAAPRPARTVHPTVDLTASDSGEEAPIPTVVPALAAPPPTGACELDDELEDVDCEAYADEEEEAEMDDVAIAPDASEPDAPLQVVVQPETPHAAARMPRARREMQWTPRDRRNRVLVHQIHVLCILAAARIRNAWCNDVQVRDVLLDSVPDHLLHKLYAIHPKREPERRERVRLFEAFAQDLVLWWASRFRLHAQNSAATAWRQPSTALLHSRVPPHTWVDGWLTETPEERAAFSKRRRRPPMQIAVFPPGSATQTPTYLRLLPSDAPKCAGDLSEAARTRLGTHETSVMLFCALCRALGIPARLVVSVQAGPCTAAAAKAPGTHRRALRPGESFTGDAHAPYVEPVDPRAPPTMWVEAFSKPYQHWITLDPIRALMRVTGNKHMEPLPTNQQNRLVYVVGFEEDGWARDVTARYTRTLYSKVARQRPEAVGRARAPHAAQPSWWEGVVRALHRPQRLDRDAAEDVELQDWAAREPMPTSLGAFKDHPVFCLEQFLRRDQVVDPPNRVGTFQGRPVYLRANVVSLQSARQWYNEGRMVRPGAQPLKHVKARGHTLLNRRMEEQARAEGQEAWTEALYAHSQTDVYVPPPVQNGRVPTNAFGNVDLFVPSMLPRGGAHIPHPLAAKAAKQLHVSYAEAVVGFEFRRFRSLPRTRGAVVAQEQAPRVYDTIRAIEEQAAASEHAKRQARAVKGWRRLLTALTVAKRVKEQYGAQPVQPVPRDAAPQLRCAAPSETRQLRPAPEVPEAPEALDVPEARTAPAAAAAPLDTPPARIISLDELMAREAGAMPRGTSGATSPAPVPSAAALGTAAHMPSPDARMGKRRRIVVRRSAPAPRRSARPAARAAAEAWRAADASAGSAGSAGSDGSDGSDGA